MEKDRITEKTTIEITSEETSEQDVAEGEYQRDVIANPPRPASPISKQLNPRVVYTPPTQTTTRSGRKVKPPTKYDPLI